MHDLPERIASTEAKIDAHEKEIQELLRQKSAMWERVDEIQEAIDNLKLDAAKEAGRMETKLSAMDKNALLESFGMKTQIAEIGWRVGLIVSGVLLILNFLIGKIDIVDFIVNRNSQVKSIKR